VKLVLLAALSTCVLTAAALMALAPAVVASRYHPSKLLRSE